MRNLLLSSLAVSALIMSSCGMMEMKPIDMEKTRQFEDGIIKAIPGNSSIHTLQKDDYSKVTIIVGNTGLYANKDKVQEAAVKVGAIVLQVLGPDASITRGTFAVVQHDDNRAEVPDGAITGDMKIDSLKKAMFGK